MQHLRLSKDEAWLLSLIVLFAGLILFELPKHASELPIIPDSVEYAVGALEIAETGRYELRINDEVFPPRYLPWFSLFALSPMYLVFGAELGNGVLSVFLFSLLGVVAAFFLGRRIGGRTGGVLASLFVLLLPDYLRLSALVMTDVPATALALLCCLLYLGSEKEVGPWRFLWTGALVALSASFRPVSVFLLIPFLLLPKNSFSGNAWLGKIYLCVFPALIGVISLVYNSRVFGSPLRTGYHYWVSLPYDFPELVFSWSYLVMNLGKAQEVLWFLAVALVVLLSVLLVKAGDETLSKNSPEYRLLVFFFLGFGPIVVFHLFYFYPERRFYLGVAALLAALLGGLIAKTLTRFLPSQRVSVSALAVLVVLAICVRFESPGAAGPRLKAAKEIARVTPADALIISGVDPVYLERFVVRGSGRAVIPLNRHVEYASKFVAPKRISHSNTHPNEYGEALFQWLREAGATQAVELVAVPVTEEFLEVADSEQPLYLESSHLRAIDLLELKEWFAFEAVGRNLFRLRGRGL